MVLKMEGKDLALNLILNCELLKFKLVVIHVATFLHIISTISGCQPIRPSIKARGIQIVCSLDGNPVDCFSCGIKEGTQATYKCAANYNSTVPYITGSTMTCGAEGTWTGFNMFLAFSCQPTCGPTHSVAPYIIGGTSVTPEKWPCHGMLFFGSFSQEYICGGTLIGPLSLLTASHCLQAEDPSKYTVIFGASNPQMTAAKSDSNAQVYSVLKIDKHPEYKGIPDYYHHDVALLTLNASVTFTTRVMPACLPEEPEPEVPGQEDHGIAVGFGKTDDAQQVLSTTLQEAQIDLLPIIYCKPYFEMANIDYSIQMCAGSKGKMGHACNGDSGGGLYRYEELSGRSYVAGIVSYGSPGGCHLPSIFTRVYSFRSWILGTVYQRISEYYDTLDRSKVKCPLSPRPTPSTAKPLPITQAPPPLPVNVAPSPLPPHIQEQEILHNINQYRVQHEAKPLKLRQHISAKAQSFAHNLTSTNSSLRAAEGIPYGQTLYELTIEGRVPTPEEITKNPVDSWYNTKSTYDPNAPAPIAFTQLVWKASNELGVGISTQGPRTVIVCYYNPAGNQQEISAADSWHRYKLNVTP